MPKEKQPPTIAETIDALLKEVRENEDNRPYLRIQLLLARIENEKLLAMRAQNSLLACIIVEIGGIKGGVSDILRNESNPNG